MIVPIAMFYNFNQYKRIIIGPACIEIVIHNPPEAANDGS